MSKTWLWALTILQVLLIVPYVSKILPWAYGEGLMPIKPVVYQLGIGVLNLLVALRFRPDFTKMALLLVLLLLMRAVDTILLERFVFPTGDQFTRATGLFSNVFMTLVFIFALGVMYKTSFLPAKAVAFCTVVVCAGAVLLEVAGFIQETEAAGRFSGFVGDPNRACTVMMLMLAIFLVLNRGFWLNIALIAVAAAGAFPTLSRGGLLMLALISIAFFVRNFRQYAGQFILVGLAAVPMIAVGVGLLLTKSSEGGKSDQNAKSRIAAIFSGDVGKMNSVERTKDLRDGFEAAIQRPIFGYGSGAGSDMWQPHNQVVSVWLDLGLLGLIPYLGILGLVVWKTMTTGFRTVYVAIPLVLYLFLSQALLENFAYLYAIVFCSVATTTDFISLRFRRKVSRTVVPAGVPVQEAMLDPQAAFEIFIDDYDEGSYVMCSPESAHEEKVVDDASERNLDSPVMEYVVPMES